MELAHLTLVTHGSSPLPSFLTFGLGYPFLHLVSTFFTEFYTPWSTATWFKIMVNWLSVPLLFECLLEGGWYAYFKWFKQPLAWIFYHFATSRVIPHQSFVRDVRFWLPTMSITLDVTLGGRNVMPYARRTRSSFCHHQYGIRLRLRYRLVPIKMCLGRRRGRYRSVHRESSFTSRKNFIPAELY